MRLERFIASDNGKEINIFDRYTESLFNLDSESRLEFLKNPNREEFSDFKDNIYVKKALLMKSGWNFPLKTYIMVTNSCNLRCKYCYLSSEFKLKDELDTFELKKLIDDLNEMGVVLVSFNGGEPFMRPDFLEILEYTESKKIGFSVSTNGILLTDEIVKKLKNFDGWIKISLDGSSKIHNQLRGPNSFERTVKNLENLNKNKIKFILQMTLTKSNITEMSFVAKLAKKNNAQYVKYGLIRPSGRALDNSFLSELNYKDLEVIDKEIKEIKKIGIKTVFSNDFPQFNNFDKGDGKLRLMDKYFGCAAGRTAISIRPDGKITPCIFFPDSFDAGNIREGVSKLIENSSIFKKMREYEPNSVCSSCNWLKSCSGGCRARAFVNTQKINGIDPFCKKQDPKH